MEIEDLNDEIDVHIEQDEEGAYVARLFHKLSNTIKISEPCDSAKEALDNGLASLQELLKERMKGLGK